MGNTPGSSLCRRNAARADVRRLTVVAGRLEFLGAQLVREAVEHTVDDLWLVGLEERLGGVDVLVDRDTRRHVGTLEQFEHARPQNGAQNGIDADETPAGRKLLIDERI